MKAKIKQFNVIFRPEPEGGFTVIVPSLPGCITYGKNLSQAKEMAQDAISGYLVSLKKHRQEISSDGGSFISLLSVGAHV
ncbi:MAG: type II toxin-antitoxin system HicB family antitoxin [Candidatus Kaiserbacteria bacterium]|nr:type II toxin-antitoxin system HicB family antitoxin [Candidatus Kaiserbacteria bacterium]